MKKLFLALLLLCSAGAYAAVPTLSVVQSRTTCTAPCFVMFDMTATTGGAVPVRDNYFTANFGDPTAGNWANGVSTGMSKNFCVGAVCGHVYETAGTFTASFLACNASGCAAKQTKTTTVTAANTTFATNTACIASSTTPAANMGGCPAGATGINAAGNLTSAMTAARGANGCGIGIPCRRYLLKRGDTFASTATTDFSTTAAELFGAYGSGALPTINHSTTNPVLGVSSTAVADLMIMDVNIVGTGVAEQFCVGIGASTASTNITVLRMTCTAAGSGVKANGSCPNNGYFSYSTVQDSTISGMNGDGIYLELRHSQIAGNAISIAPLAASQFTTRLNMAQTSRYNNNTLSGTGAADSGKQFINVRANPHACGASPTADTYDAIISDNLVDATIAASNNFVIQFGPSQTNYVYRVIAERNWIKGSPATQDCFAIGGTSITIRNNVCDLSASTYATRRMIDIPVLAEIPGSTPAPDDYQFVNNTLYVSTATTNSYFLVSIFDAPIVVTNVTVKNNLIYTPLVSNTGTVYLDCVSACITTPSLSNNTNAFGGSTPTFITSPSFDSISTFAGFRPATSGYGVNGGAAIFPASYYDALNCKNKAGHVRMGAFEPRAEAQCASSGGQ